MIRHILLLFAGPALISFAAPAAPFLPTTVSPRSACQSDSFVCHDGRCIPGTWRCDGDLDCSDGADEADCGRTDEEKVSALIAGLMRVSEEESSSTDLPSDLPSALLNATADEESMQAREKASSYTKTPSFSPEALALGEFLSKLESQQSEEKMRAKEKPSSSDDSLSNLLNSPEALFVNEYLRDLSLQSQQKMRLAEKGVNEFLRDLSSVPPQSTTTTTSSPLSITRGPYEMEAFRVIEERLKALEQEPAHSTTVASVETTSTAAPSDLINNKPAKYIVRITVDQTSAIGGRADAPAAMGTIKSMEYADPGQRTPQEIRVLVEQNLAIRPDRIRIEVINTN